MDNIDINEIDYETLEVLSNEELQKKQKRKPIENTVKKIYLELIKKAEDGFSFYDFFIERHLKDEDILKELQRLFPEIKIRHVKVDEYLRNSYRASWK